MNDKPEPPMPVLGATSSLKLLDELVTALDKTHWSSWQTSANFEPVLECAREYLRLSNFR